jgi:queuine tRNA-ribosyltransferase
MTGTFTVTATDAASNARTGTLELAHGAVETPVFMPVGTNATVKALSKDDLSEIGFKLILANTYHLYLKPGKPVIEKFSGLHGFSGWKGNFLTDSGGFQVFSLAPFRKITDDGIKFRSHIDGSPHFFKPEDVVELQTAFQSDIMMQLDVCSAYGVERKEAERALKLTSAWAMRSKMAWEERRGRTGGLLFPIVQGNFFEDLRKRSAEEICALDLPGIAIGGLSVGEPFGLFQEMLGYTAALLPKGKPRYLMGIGTPEFILEAVNQGIDMFDCVFPTRTARNGLLFTRDGPIAIKKARYECDTGPIDRDCGCKVCREYSRAYLRHLFRSGEILYSMLASYHNLAFLKEMIDEIRSSIVNQRFSAYRESFLARYGNKGE